MRQFSIIAIGIVLMFVLAACNGGGGGRDGGGSAPTTPFLEGSKGIEIKFLEGDPPEEVTDGGTFDFQSVVSLKNQGEFDLKKEQVKVDIVGILPEDFGVSMDDLRGRVPEDDPTPRRRDSEGNIIDAIETFVTFPSEDGFFNFERSVTGNTIFIFRANVCYKYQTKALSRICVLRDLINVDDNSVCDPSESKRTFSSAAPVKVASLRQTVAGQDRIQFNFDITKSGSEEVFKEGDATSPAADCPTNPRERREKENKILVEVDTGLPNLRCVGLEGGTRGYITMVDGRRTVTCTQELDPGRNDFETNVEITLGYNIKDFEQREVLVKHLVDN